MPFGSAPFVGLDSLISRRRRQMLDSGLPIATPPFVPDVNLPEGFPTMGQTEAQAQTQPESQSFLSRLGQRLTSDEGIAGLSSGLQAAAHGRGGLESLLLGFTGGMQGRQGVRAAHEAEAAKIAEEAKKYGLEERRVAADESRAQTDKYRAEHPAGTASTRQTKADEFAAQLSFLQQIGASKDQILSHFLASTGAGGRGGAQRQTDLDKVAQGLVSSGRAKSLNEAYVIARTLSQQPQFVGSITKLVPDPNNIDGFRQVRVNVSRVLDPITGDFKTIDSFGNELTPQEMSQIQTDVGRYGGDTGPPAPPSPAPPADNQQPAGGIHRFIRRQAPVASH